VSVPLAKHGLIIGPMGKHMRSLQEKTGTKINMPDKASCSNKVTIVGPKDSIRECRDAIRDLIHDGFSVLTHEGWVKEEVHFPRDQLGKLIGAKGQNIKSIKGNTSTEIRVPKSDDIDQDTIVVAGLPSGVAQAKKEILRYLDEPAVVDAQGSVSDDEDEAAEREADVNAFSAAATAGGDDMLW